jgi:hypothetical protein
MANQRRLPELLDSTIHQGTSDDAFAQTTVFDRL